MLRADSTAQVDLLSTPELRTGTWTRFGGERGLGDPITEHVLADLAESTKAAARAQGYATGWAEGRREAAAEAAAQRAEIELMTRESEARREAEHQQAVAGLRAAVLLFQQQVAATCAEVEDHALELARELTETLVARELSTAADPVADVVRRALAVLPQGVPVTVRLSPAVAGDPALEVLREQGVTIAMDPSLERHDALVESTVEAVDLQVSAALARVREVLS